MHYVYIRFRPLVPRGLQRGRPRLWPRRSTKLIQRAKASRRRAASAAQRRTKLTYDALRLYSLSPACSSRATARQAPLSAARSTEPTKGETVAPEEQHQRPGRGPTNTPCTTSIFSNRLLCPVISTLANPPIVRR